MKIIVEKDKGFVIDGETDRPEAVQILRQRFGDYVDAAGDLVFCEDDLDVYAGEFIPFLKETGTPGSS